MERAGENFQELETLLVSGSPQERVHAALQLGRGGRPEHVAKIREMLLGTGNARAQMILAPIVVGWEDETYLEILRAPDADVRAIYAIVKSLAVQKRGVPLNGIAFLLDHSSPFVRYALLDYRCAMKQPVVHLDAMVSDIRADAMFLNDADFDDSWPSPIFGNKERFLRRVAATRKCLSDVNQLYGL